MASSPTRPWAALGIGEQVHALALRAYDQMIGLGVARGMWRWPVDGHQAPCGGECAVTPPQAGARAA